MLKLVCVLQGLIKSCVAAIKEKVYDSIHLKDQSSIKTINPTQPIGVSGIVCGVMSLWAFSGALM